MSKPTVHILVRVRKPELLPVALLWAQTIRTGFPTYGIQVWGNQLGTPEEDVVRQACHVVGAQFQNIARTSHDAWIESLILENTAGPFWICDTDVIFWESMETLHVDAAKYDYAFAGRFEPEFEEPYTNTRHVERLHTCLMFINPAVTRAAIRAFMSEIPEDLRATAQFPLVREYFIPSRTSKTIFYDTMAGLYQAGYGSPFLEEEDARFEHLNCGSYSDLIGKFLSDSPGGESADDGAPRQQRPTLTEQHLVVCRNIQLARGLRSFQQSIYERFKPKDSPVSARDAQPDPRDAGATTKEEICRSIRE